MELTLWNAVSSLASSIPAGSFVEILFDRNWFNPLLVYGNVCVLLDEFHELLVVVGASLLSMRIILVLAKQKAFDILVEDLRVTVIIDGSETSSHGYVFANLG